MVSLSTCHLGVLSWITILSNLVTFTRKVFLADFNIRIPAAKDPCSRCDFTNGQIWLPDHSNCHLYYICEPLGSGEYSKLHATCGELFWNQAYHTCVPVMPEDSDCDEGPVSLYIQPTTPKGESVCYVTTTDSTLQ